VELAKTGTRVPQGWPRSGDVKFSGEGEHPWLWVGWWVGVVSWGQQGVLF